MLSIAESTYGDVRGVLALALRGSHTDEVDGGVGSAALASVVKASRPVARALLQELGKTRLVERSTALRESAATCSSSTSTPTTSCPRAGHAGSVDGTEVAAPEDCDLNGVPRTFRVALFTLQDESRREVQR